MKSIRQQLVQYLLNHPDYVSGEMLSRKLNVSRTAIWKHIEELRKEGYQIEAVRKQGYKLLAEPHDLSPSAITSRLSTQWLGQTLHYFPVISSTQTEAHRLAQEGAPSGTVVVADQQEKGKGRFGRFWHSPPHTGLWFSFILRPTLPLYAMPQLTLLTAVAVLKGIKKVIDVPLTIKWPNDLLIDGKKVAGILTELKAETDQVHYVVIGIGINVNQRSEDFPEELRHLATSLAIAAGRPLPRKEVIIQVLNTWEAIYSQYRREGFQPIKRDWEAYSSTLGKRITAQTTEGYVTGTAKGIDQDGALEVEDAQGRIHKIYSANIES